MNPDPDIDRLANGLPAHLSDAIREGALRWPTQHFGGYGNPKAGSVCALGAARFLALEVDDKLSSFEPNWQRHWPILWEDAEPPEERWILAGWIVEKNELGHSREAIADVIERIEKDRGYR